MRRVSYLLCSLVLLGLIQVPAFGQAKKEELKAPPKMPAPPGPSFKHLDGQLLVFVVNGVGGSTSVSDNLLDLNSDKHLGLRIQMIPWCRHNALFKDLVDGEAQLNAAVKIACQVTAIRKDAPNAHIFLIGHSAGARIVLAAAEMSPKKSLDRVIVLAPAVSCNYDLTTALKATRYGIDNFYSPEDGILESDHYRNADGQPGKAAGRVGFHSSACDKKEADAYRNVRQYRWTDEFCGSGGHYAWTLRHNMKKVIVPLFFSAPVVEPLPAIIPPKKLPEKKEK